MKPAAKTARKNVFNMRVLKTLYNSIITRPPAEGEGHPQAVYQYAFALAHGAGEGLFYYGDWIRKPGVAICSCNDGLRPVIFKLEATGEDSRIDYEPVR